ncbi:hypothetical protein M8J76_011534 [Diaphorina citri]|nr:hypothetical protein M8J76_011534 [Diaphorina citri]
MNAYLQKHTTLVHTQQGRPYTCDKCESSFKTSENLKSHMAIHSETKMFKCNECNMKCRTKMALKIHSTSHQLDLPFECELCEYRCARKSNLRSHMSTHSENCSYVCEHCEFCANTEDDLEEHVVNAHFRPTHPVAERKKSTAPPKSSVLQQQISSRHTSVPSSHFLSRFVIRNKNAMREERCKTDVKSFSKLKRKPKIYTAMKCPECPASFKYNVYLKRHINEKHDDVLREFVVKSEDLDDPLFSCMYCDFKTTKKIDMKSHVSNHYIEKKAQDDLNKAYKCSFCGLRINKMKYMKAHLKTHTEQPHLQCPDCDFRTRLPHTLKLHQLTHTGKRPFNCDKCDYGAYRAKNLEAHINRFHNFQKPYKCETCVYRATTKDILIKHVKRCSGNMIKTKKSPNKYTIKETRDEIQSQQFLDEDVQIPIVINEKLIADTSNTLQVSQSEEFDENVESSNAEFIIVNVPPLVCNLCDFTFHEEDEFNEHMSCHLDEEVSSPIENTNDTAPINTEQPNFIKTESASGKVTCLKSCGVCDFNTYEIMDLQRHVFQNHIESLKCNHCNSTYQSVKQLKEHNCNVNPVKYFFCKYCNYYCNEKYLYEEHVSSHNNKYKCQQCEFESKYKRTVQEHYFVHTNLRPYKCEQPSISSSLEITVTPTTSSSSKNTDLFPSDHKRNESDDTVTNMLYNSVSCVMDENQQTTAEQYSEILRKHGVEISPFVKQPSPSTVNNMMRKYHKYLSTLPPAALLALANPKIGRPRKNVLSSNNVSIEPINQNRPSESNVSGTSRNALDVPRRKVGRPVGWRKNRDFQIQQGPVVVQRKKAGRPKGWRKPRDPMPQPVPLKQDGEFSESVSVFSLLNNLPLDVEALLSNPMPFKLNTNFCQHCGVVMSNTRIASLIEHCRSCPAMFRPDVYKYKFVCYACNYFTYQVSNIKNHILIHLGAKPFVCELCQCTFRHNHHLQRHMKTHVKYSGFGEKDNIQLSNGFLPDACANGQSMTGAAKMSPIRMP